MTTALHALTGADLLEQRMQSTFGMGSEEYRDSIAKPVPLAYLNAAIRIVDRSGVIEQLTIWDAQKRKSSAGRKPYIPARAVLVLFLLHMQQSLGVNYKSMATSLHRRLQGKHFHALGILDIAGDETDWYKRLWGSSHRLLTLVDPYPVPRRRIIKDADAWARLDQCLKTDLAKERERIMKKRLDWLCNKLIATSVGFLPRDVWENYRGNMAIDATKIQLAGRPNSADNSAGRANPDPLSGRYRREGSHDGKGAKTDDAAYELEAATMVWNKPGENDLFPSLVTAVSFHRPGEIVGEGVKLASLHKEFGFDRFLLLCDRAYSNGKPQQFHLPLRQMGVELVFDYTKDDTGVQGSYGNLLLVDGNWYIDTIPEKLINASAALVALRAAEETAKWELKQAKNRRDNHADGQRETIAAAEQLIAESLTSKERLYRIINNRARYRMIPKGLPDADGYQRFTYPPHYTPTATDKGAGARTISIPPTANDPHKYRKSKIEPLKFLQKYQYQSEEWRAHYGMRNLIETRFKNVKHPGEEDLGVPAKRSGRGYAFQYLASALGMVSSNIRRIIGFFEKESTQETGGKKIRTRRRKDPSGTPLSRMGHQQELAPPA